MAGIERTGIKAYNIDIAIFVAKTICEASADVFDAAVISGGRSPGRLMEDEDALEFVRNSGERNSLLAGICHGSRVLLSAGVLEGKAATGVGGISGELEEARVVYVDEEAVRDGNIRTPRVPNDMPAFNAAISEALFR